MRRRFLCCEFSRLNHICCLYSCGFGNSRKNNSCSWEAVASGWSQFLLGTYPFVYEDKVLWNSSSFFFFFLANGMVWKCEQWACGFGNEVSIVASCSNLGRWHFYFSLLASKFRELTGSKPAGVMIMGAASWEISLEGPLTILPWWGQSVTSAWNGWENRSRWLTAASTPHTQELKTVMILGLWNYKWKD